MVDSIFLLGPQRTLVEMIAQPYDTEGLLQELLANYPSLITGQQVDNAAPRRWLLISREIGVPDEEGGSGRWSLDHLFLDQDGIPTLIEVKRSTDSRIRREVVGQMLDYAANAIVYWPVEHIRACFRARHENEEDADRELLEFLDEDADAGSFWGLVKTNLQAGKVRMIFVADVVPSELQRVVEFLNSQMDPAEVLALEVRQYVGDGLKTLVPRVIGNTALAQSKKREGAFGNKQWNEKDFMNTTSKQYGPSIAKDVQALLDWGHNNCEISYGKGNKWGSFSARTISANGKKNILFYVWNDGKTMFLELPLGYFTLDCKLSDLAARQEFLRRANKIPGINLPADSVEKRRSFPIKVLAEGTGLSEFLAILDWAMSEIKTGR